MKRVWLVYTFSKEATDDSMNLHAVCDSEEKAQKIKDELYWEDITDVCIEWMEMNKVNW